MKITDFEPACQRAARGLHRALASLLLLVALPAGAASLQPLESRLGGLAWYDPNLGITWAADADLLGESTLNQATVALAGLVIGGVSSWRLPITDRNDDGVAIGCKGLGVDACLDNELGFMLNVRLVSANAPGPFTELQADWYWSSSDNPFNAPRVYAWLMADGAQEGFGDAHPDNTGLRTWAVHDGDVAPVPLPAPALLLPAALAALGTRRRR
ncbi:MAG: hypothetical protein KDK06_00330 [Gammaproteobacteria bacterium]|nr:hypothetical protein [Gammaproteobacteria bacterium]